MLQEGLAASEHPCPLRQGFYGRSQPVHCEYRESEKGIRVREKELIGRTPEPRTRLSLVADLRPVGLEPGVVVIAHSSLSSLGWVCGGLVAVVQALIDWVTESGIIGGAGTCHGL